MRPQHSRKPMIDRSLPWTVAALLLLSAAPLLTTAAAAQQASDHRTAASGVQAQVSPPESIPRFEDYPASKVFTGKPASVNLRSHKDARQFRTRLAAPFEKDTLFAGHYRIVRIGCGMDCQLNFIIDLADGSVMSLRDSTYGSLYQSGSRLLIINDPRRIEELLETGPVEDAVSFMTTYGAPQYWLEDEGKLRRIAPVRLDIDPLHKRLVAK
jgi:hypothetical protein